jgi:predicted alpha/beta superfamily hydrolase
MGLVALLVGKLLSGQDVARLTLVVTVPEGTDRVTVAGNQPSLGNWDPAAIPLERIVSNRFRVTIPVPAGQTIEYKFTRGSWATEALTARRSIPGNYRLVVSQDTTIYHAIPYWKDDLISPGAGITGTVRYHRHFYSPQLENYRDIVVWLPPSYHQDTYRRFPVLYFHDGQNMVDPSTSFAGYDWQLDETATRMIKEGILEEILLVGLYNTSDRRAEYSPTHRGSLYSAFLMETVKPFIDSTYRTLPDREHTAVMGSSLGGLIAFHLVWTYPEVFSRAGCLSPAFLVDDGEIVDRVRRYHGPKKPVKLAILNGTEGLEAELRPAVNQMVTALRKQGYRDGKELLYRVVPGAEHNEQAWAQQAPEVLLFLFGKSR